MGDEGEYRELQSQHTERCALGDHINIIKNITKM